MATYFETKIRYDRVRENGTVKKVTGACLVDALTFSDAEARAVEKVTPFISGEFAVTAIRKTKIAEVFRDDRDSADKWWLVKVNFITLDEKSGEEKKTPSLVLVQAGNDASARERFNEGMKGTMSDYEIAAIIETPYMDVYKYEYQPNNTETK